MAIGPLRLIYLINPFTPFLANWMRQFLVIGYFSLFRKVLHLKQVIQKVCEVDMEFGV